MSKRFKTIKKIHFEQKKNLKFEGTRFAWRFKDYLQIKYMYCLEKKM